MIQWVWAFLDRPAAGFDESARFWAAVTGTTVSAKRGAVSEFVTLEPAAGPGTLKMQAVPDGGRVHLDLDVADVPGARETATRLGAELVLDHPDYAVFRSPAGLTFCLTPDGRAEPGERPPVHGPDGVTTRLDQVCLDIGASDIERETEFWRRLTGLPYRVGRRPEFALLRGRPGLGYDLLLQRLDEDRQASAHLDFAASDPAAAAAHHAELGATIVERFEHWIVMADPDGHPYCLTARDPHGV
ncbi:VOC family protein [Nocardia sp. NPDC057353]|uniref:VOC family protein n=1 Tax=Nocardia sp. NPDC057353 TaxID=3346104 RepID=UPI00363A9CDE